MEKELSKEQVLEVLEQVIEKYIGSRNDFMYIEQAMKQVKAALADDKKEEE